jgi:peptide methionine sulfoxide reductase MsrB
MQGHVFQGEGYRKANGEKIDERHCVNSISLKFNDEKPGDE